MTPAVDPIPGASADLHLVHARVRRVRVPLTPGYVGSMYAMDAAVRTVVELVTVDGIVGIGEAPGAIEVFQLVHRLTRVMLGQNLRERRQLQQRFARTTFDNHNGRHGSAAYAAIETAAWDAVAQSYGLPLRVLLGGVNEAVPIDTVCVIHPAGISLAISRTASRMHVARSQNVGYPTRYAAMQAEGRGFRRFKYEGTGVNAAWDIAAMHALRSSLGDGARLQFDARGAYTPMDAIALCRGLEPVGVDFVVDPTEDLEGLASVRAQSTLPLATSMSVTQPEHLAPFARQPTADIILADVGTWGGVLQYVSLLRTAEVMGIEVGIHSTVEMGIGTVLHLHIAAAFPQIRLAMETTLHALEQPLVVGANLEVRDGYMRPPAGPGLGVHLDEAAMSRYTIDEVSASYGTSAGHSHTAPMTAS